METQQQEKESLAAYVCKFKREVKRCNFTNDVATIKIFIKSLMNAHSLATCIYEKGPQTLSDTISKVEKLIALQQLTATITPPSMVNMMSNNEDHCFQCQEHGHTARNCPNLRCFECDEYSHIIMDCPHRIPPFRTPAKHHNSKPHKIHHTKSSSRHHHEDRDRRSHSRSQSHFQRHCSSSHHDLYRGYSRSRHRDNCHHPRSSSRCPVPHTGVTVIDPATTHHIDHTTDHSHTTPEIEATHI